MLTPSARELWLFFVRFSTRSPAPPTAACAWRVARSSHVVLESSDDNLHALESYECIYKFKYLQFAARSLWLPALAAWVSGMHESPVLNPESW
eukprot:COSAG02_NODE_619_length_19446_cov_9.557141_19_plen_93_part_00